jgi:hypothetical protein
MPSKPIVYTSVAIAAASPFLLHGHPTVDCNPRVALCALSDAAYLPDEPAPEHAPPLIFAPPVAGSTVSMPSSAILVSPVPLGWLSAT